MAKQVVIQNPVINSPFEEPRRHFRFDDDGITDDIANGRRDAGTWGRWAFVEIADPWDAKNWLHGSIEKGLGRKD